MADGARLSRGAPASLSLGDRDDRLAGQQRADGEREELAILALQEQAHDAAGRFVGDERHLLGESSASGAKASGGVWKSSGSRSSQGHSITGPSPKPSVSQARYDSGW